MPDSTNSPAVARSTHKTRPREFTFNSHLPLRLVGGFQRREKKPQQQKPSALQRPRVSRIAAPCVDAFQNASIARFPPIGPAPGRLDCKSAQRPKETARLRKHFAASWRDAARQIPFPARRAERITRRRADERRQSIAASFHSRASHLAARQLERAPSSRLDIFPAISPIPHADAARRRPGRAVSHGMALCGPIRGTDAALRSNHAIRAVFSNGRRPSRVT